ncbi:hypothetical protein BU26DRAFT_603474 [Trematosphaeria pertusa]|uniref:Fluoroacetyl-CoA-specific thioesterase-like domain-containing protein n=1 Tax=Trematosphaeria pertusa TaxID=390896 RepID=A0A6A6IKM9_9PLEO|nr:uncharacterized protein BU26DRAFT_603474 [Trematosphaeria pertusa]KAF2250971.1 hypothetical protein BU26DRAFT_603474 [Trematosphaeria pertusa]
MSKPDPQLNSTITATFTVRPNDLASAISPDPNDRFPAVFSTSRLVALMEIASARLLEPCLSPGQLSVGVRIDVTHSAPTPEGTEVTAEAKFVGREGKLFVFEVIARDPAGEIGRARHERAIINVERLENAARKRILEGERVPRQGEL